MDVTGYHFTIDFLGHLTISSHYIGTQEANPEFFISLTEGLHLTAMSCPKPVKCCICTNYFQPAFSYLDFPSYHRYNNSFRKENISSMKPQFQIVKLIFGMAEWQNTNNQSHCELHAVDYKIK